MRTRAGLFDVSHMGQVELAGKDALAAVQQMTSNDASTLKVGQVHYSGLMTPAGTFVDDLLVYRLANQHFLFVVNASNVEKDVRWIVEAAQPFGDVAVVDTSSRYALIALQGPAARQVMQTQTDVDLSAIKYYWFAPGEVAGARVTILAHRLYGRERLRDFHAAPVRREGVGGADQRRPRHRRHPVRPRRPRHAAPRGGHASLRPRHRRHDLGPRGRPGVDCRLEQGRLHRPRGAGGPEGERPGAAAGRLRDGGPRHRPARLRRAGGRRQGRDGDQRHADAVPQEGDRHGVPAGRPDGAGRRVRGGFRGRRARARVVPLPFYKRPKG